MLDPESAVPVAVATKNRQRAPGNESTENHMPATQNSAVNGLKTGKSYWQE
jgi:hypothetical protein